VTTHGGKKWGKGATKNNFEKFLKFLVEYLNSEDTQHILGTKLTPSGSLPELKIAIVTHSHMMMSIFEKTASYKGVGKSLNKPRNVGMIKKVLDISLKEGRVSESPISPYVTSFHDGDGVIFAGIRMPETLLKRDISNCRFQVTVPEQGKSRKLKSAKVKREGHS